MNRSNIGMRRAGLLLLLLLLAGCAGMQPGYETPTVTVTAFRSLPGDGGLPRFEIGLRIVNPNASALALRGIAYSISLAGHRVIAGVANQLPEVAGYGTGEVTLVADVDLLSGIALVTDLVRNEHEEIAYSFDAKLDLGALRPALRATREGTLRLGGSGRGAGG
ncbi:MAG TPA: LEA type 2 family protein [Gammaproteobacteria bacterium]